jgi:hypothetical protein
MNRPDHSTYREWLTLGAGELGDREKALLEDHLSSCADCREEREEFLAFDTLLRRAEIPVRQDFKSTVMNALPTAGWESRSPRAWGFPAAMVLLLGSLAVALLMAGAPSATGGAGALFAVGGMLKAALMAGAGLLGASWKGLGLVLDDLIASPVSLGAFGFLVLCLNLFLVSLIRRRGPAREAARRR